MRQTRSANPDGVKRLNFTLGSVPSGCPSKETFCAGASATLLPELHVRDVQQMTWPAQGLFVLLSGTVMLLACKGVCHDDG